MALLLAREPIFVSFVETRQGYRSRNINTICNTEFYRSFSQLDKNLVLGGGSSSARCGSRFENRRRRKRITRGRQRKSFSRVAIWACWPSARARRRRSCADPREALPSLPSRSLFRRRLRFSKREPPSRLYYNRVFVYSSRTDEVGFNSVDGRSQ